MKILAIETSFDDTCVAILEDDRVLSNIISNQSSFHKKHGGVIPSLARDKHKELIDPCIKKALAYAKVKMEDIDVFAVTYGPGLAISLEVGIQKVKDLHVKYKKPVVAVNHLEGHLLSPFLKNKNGKYYTSKKPVFPFLSAIVSGAHTQLVLVKSIGEYTLLGQTLDDAAGEAFDKVARLLKLGYPGGPLIAKIAEKGDKTKYDLPRCMEFSKDFNFSFSGLKTASLNKLRKVFDEKNKGDKKAQEQVSFKKKANYYDSKDMFLSKQEVADFAASFEFAVVEIITKKIIQAVKRYDLTFVSIGGGVTANISLRAYLRKELRKIGVEVAMPKMSYCMDNAGMIGLVAYHKAKKGEFEKDPLSLDREPVLNFTK
jgi:N6-L-threonylcarbamoyladenine synthase